MFQNSKGEDVPRRKSKHKARGIEIPRQGQIAADVKEAGAIITQVNAEFKTKYKDPYDLMHHGEKAHQLRYCDLSGFPLEG